jgi:tRNA-splicing ligase RtcB (3'-phosphate/5'-hydroxy nucleic acid ligase)
MFVINNLQEQKYPIKVWLSNREEIEDECLRQAHNISKLPFLHKWVALMPDTHAGMGMPIGGVIATEGVVIPNAVGVDIGCGAKRC